MSEKYKLDNIEDIIAERYEEFEDLDYVVIELNDESRMELDGIRVYVPELDLSLVSGVVSMLDHDTKEFEPDFSITAIYQGKEFDFKDWLYYEQDGMVVSLHNYLYSVNKQKQDKYEGDYECYILE